MQSSIIRNHPYRSFLIILPILLASLFWNQLITLLALSAGQSANPRQTASTPFLIKDIYTNTVTSEPKGFTGVNGTVYFHATEPTSGYELWKSDGTVTGTVMVKQINPLGDAFNYARQDMIQIDGILYFVANDGVHGYELWRSDGTEQGTRMVKDVNPAGHAFPPHSIPEMIRIGELIYFAATNDVDGWELWRSDGSEEGTVQIADINPVGDSFPNNFTEMDGVLFFSAYSGGHQRELWRSDGTEAGTALVAGFDNSGIYNPDHLAVMSQTLYFSADQMGFGVELWQSDGTLTGTVLVRDIVSGPGNSSPDQLTVLNETLFFTADTGLGRELWRSDGTHEGTVIVRDIYAGFWSSDPQNLFVFGDLLVFAANDGIHGWELWKSDGTGVGTSLIKDIDLNGGSVSFDLFMAVLNNTLFFNAYDGINGGALWQSDGSEAGTTMVLGADLMPVLWPRFITAIDGILYFSAIDQKHSSEPWRSDGTAVGTYMIKDINTATGGSGAAEYYGSHRPLPVGDKVFFAANDGYAGAELWVSDRTTTNTFAVTNLPSASPNSSFVNNIVQGNSQTLYFTHQDAGPNTSLWKMDILSYDSSPLITTNATIYSLTPVDNLLFFVNRTSHEPQLWVTDGSITGTTFLVNRPGDLVAFNNALYFSRSELWMSDGTVANTVQLTNIHPDFGAWGLVQAGDLLFFSGDDQVHGRELWVSDGTAVGTRLVRDIRPGASSSGSHYSVAVGDRVYFAANDGQHGEELWVSDGTQAGTYLVKDIHLNGSSFPTAMRAGNGRLFFIADDGIHGKEIWVSDGTEAGTYMVKDVNPNGDAVNYDYLTYYSLNDLYFISLDDGIHGVELWVSDGTEIGTFLVADLNPYGDAFAPFTGRMAGEGQWLYFSASDGFSGNELWALDASLVIHYGVALSGDAQADGFPGQTMTYVLTATNTGSLPDTIDFSVLATWTVDLPISTLLLGPGEHKVFTATVQIPTSVGDGDSDTAIIHAVSRKDPEATGTIVLTTTAHLYKTYLPFLMQP